MPLFFKASTSFSCKTSEVLAFSPFAVPASLPSSESASSTVAPTSVDTSSATVFFASVSFATVSSATVSSFSSVVASPSCSSFTSSGFLRRLAFKSTFSAKSSLS